MMYMERHGFACSGCGKPLLPGDEYDCCADCGAIFCSECSEGCLKDGHACDPEEGGYEDG